jgi:hypothetical protein
MQSAARRKGPSDLIGLRRDSKDDEVARDLAHLALSAAAADDFDVIQPAPPCLLKGVEPQACGVLDRFLERQRESSHGRLFFFGAEVELVIVTDRV